MSILNTYKDLLSKLLDENKITKNEYQVALVEAIDIHYLNMKLIYKK